MTKTKLKVLIVIIILISFVIVVKNKKIENYPQNTIDVIDSYRSKTTRHTAKEDV